MEIYIKETGQTACLRGTGYFIVKKACIKENGSEIKEMDMVHLYGQMVENILESGWKINNMEKLHILIHKAINV